MTTSSQIILRLCEDADNHPTLPLRSKERFRQLRNRIKSPNGWENLHRDDDLLRSLVDVVREMFPKREVGSTKNKKKRRRR